MNQFAIDLGGPLQDVRRIPHEQVMHVSDPESGLRAIIAIHSTALGPAIGGCRMRAYPDPAAGLREAMDLSRAMTRRAALAGVAMGGGACVVFADPACAGSRAVLPALGRAVGRMRGRFRMTRDLGISADDMDVLRAVTPHVIGSADGVADLEAATAYGLLLAITAAVSHHLGRSSLVGTSVAVLGLDGVGECLCRHLAAAGAQLVVADTCEERVQAAVSSYDATRADPYGIVGMPVDVLAPCCTDLVLDDRLIVQIGARIIAGATYNQVQHARLACLLMQRRILYVPEDVAGAGGLIAASLGTPCLGSDLVFLACESIHDTTMRVLRQARRLGITPFEMADQMAAALLTPRRTGRGGDASQNTPF